MLAIGLDIGGANTKIAVTSNGGEGLEIRDLKSIYHPFWKNYRSFPKLVQKLLEPYQAVPHLTLATMTAELADCFQSKKQGVEFVLSSLLEQEPETRIILNSGSVVKGKTAISRPLEVAAANWVPTSLLIGRAHSQSLLIDSGSTTTDIIPILSGRPAVNDPTDRGRLKNRELVYTGSTRTNVATVVDSVNLGGSEIPCASEEFATMGDVNIILGLLGPGDYGGPTADGKGTNLTACMRRLARVVCSDLQELNGNQIREIAVSVRNRQIERVEKSIGFVLNRAKLGTEIPCIIAGSGSECLAKPAALKTGLKTPIPFQNFVNQELNMDVAGLEKEVCTTAPAVSLSIEAWRMAK